MTNTLHRLLKRSLFALLLPVAGTFAADWPGYRGVDGTGLSTETGVFAGREAFTLELAWKKPTGSGYSAVAVADGRVVTMFSDGEHDVMAAFNADSGAELWRFEIEETYKGHDGSHDGPIATPLIAGDHVIGLSARGRLFGLEAKTGKLAWSKNLVEEYESKKPHYGFATSPILLDGVAVVEIGAKDGLAAGFNPATGERLWIAGEDAINYASPIIYNHGGKTGVLTSSDTKNYCLNAKDGSVMWEYQHSESGMSPQGAWSMSAVPAGGDRLFLPHRDDSSKLVRVVSTGDETNIEDAWENRNIRKSYNVPVYNDGYIYGVSNRFLTCVDAETGEDQWRSREPGDGFTIMVDGHLVVMTKAGSLHVAPASPEGFFERASLTVFEDLAWSPPSFADGSFYMRGMGEIARVNIKRGKAAETVESTTGEPPADSKFAKALTRIRMADDKTAAVEALIAEQEAFPIVEGDGWVHFVYRGEGDDLAVAGDLFGARQERPMHRVDGTDLHYYSSPVEPDARLNYIFIRDYEEIVDPRNDRKADSTLIGKDMELSFSPVPFPMSWFAMPKWSPPKHLDEPASAQRGTVETKTFKSEALETDFAVDVYTPPGYEGSDARYPVALVFSGKAAIEHGKYPNTLDNLIGKTIDPVIVVFLNPPGFGMDPMKYQNMIMQDLIPYLNSEYRTIDAPAARACIGSAMGGGTPLMLGFGHSDLFGKIGAQSPFAFTAVMDALKPMITDGEKRDLTIYIDWGRYDLRNPHEAWDISETAAELAQLMKDNGYDYAGGQVNAGTDWSSWRTRTDDMFEALFPLGSSESMQ